MVLKYITILMLFVIVGCATPPVEQSLFEYAPLSKGLPTTGQWKCNPAFSDVDGDGLLDLAAMPRKGKGARVWLYRGESGWSDSSDGLAMQASTGGGIDFGDINGDGFLDLAVSDHSKGLYAFLGNGKGKWTPSSEGLPEMQSDDLALADFNADGNLDICACSAADEGIGIFWGDGKGAWRKAPIGHGFPETGSGHEIALGDINKDGIIDIAVTMMVKPRIWLSTGPNEWQESSEDIPEPQWGGQYWGVALGDVNHDGHLDLALGRIQGGPEIYIGNGRGNWTLSNTGLVGIESAWGVALADIDGDGHLDLVASGKRKRDDLGNAYGLFVYRGDGKGAWSLVEGSGLPQFGLFQGWGLCVDDIDGDGRLEIAGGFGISHSQKPPDFLLEAAGDKVSLDDKDRKWGPGGSLRVWKRIR